MKKKILFLFYFLIVVRVFSYDLSGIWMINRWYMNVEKSTTQKFSWGMENIQPYNWEIIIDEEKKNIELCGIGSFDIKKIDKISESEYLLTFYFYRGDFDVTYKVMLQNDKEFILENLTKDTQFVSEGETHHYYRVSGPKELPQYSEHIYAIFLEDSNKENTLKENEQIRIIGSNLNTKRDNEILKYEYVTENNEYGYVKANSIKIIKPELGLIMRANDNLRIRKDESQSSEIITTIMKETNVKILKFGKDEIIDGINSKWVMVEIQKGGKDREGNDIPSGTIGWCYGGYLE